LQKNIPVYRISGIFHIAASKLLSQFLKIHFAEKLFLFAESVMHPAILTFGIATLLMLSTEMDFIPKNQQAIFLTDSLFARGTEGSMHSNGHTELYQHMYICNITETGFLC